MLHTTDWFAIAAGVAAIVWVNWYFFLAERGSATVAAPAAGGPQEVTVTVRGGYDPATIRVRAGAPVRLIFDRQESSGCSEEIVFGAFGIRRFLPAHQKTNVDITPATPGTYEFTCGMGMLRGRITVDEEG